MFPFYPASPKLQMMNTVLNLGLGDEVVEGLARKRGERVAFDCYRRLLDMFGDVVLGIDHKHFEAEIHAVKVGRGARAGPGGREQKARSSKRVDLQLGARAMAFAAAAHAARRRRLRGARWHAPTAPPPFLPPLPLPALTCLGAPWCTAGCQGPQAGCGADRGGFAGGGEALQGRVRA
jgi:hypothetical protein